MQMILDFYHNLIEKMKNKTDFIDLHTHSTCSDGTFTPTELVDHAKKCGLSAMTIQNQKMPEAITVQLVTYASEQRNQSLRARGR